MKINYLFLILSAVTALSACNRSKPKPISKDVTKTTVNINGRKDSVINNPQKNYGNATVSEPCVKCLLQVIQNTASYKTTTGTLSAQSIIYKVNWITSSKPVNLSDGSKIINGMAVDINQKTGNSTKKLITYLYNNAKGTIYTSLNGDNLHKDENVSDTSLKKIRNSCFWGVASAK
ncbi:hypothetical protein [Mucilaginibacter flavidus]|uniref:hypothetical protein n=1 Tax=Mucilaginibacter flavidus TaxID=2949309 RepID=UPI0020921B78|nr:hypothetical protein [Mucilaginibacter flavidus]MCO5947718.1 hypothetical protein [Mucilaginibacter flavidus]